MHKASLIFKVICYLKKRAANICCAFFILAGLCALPLTSHGSLIDARFKLSKKLKSPHVAASDTTEVGVLYKNVFAKSMYSKCRWYPSDSQYMAIHAKRCGATRGTLLAVARFMTEHDAVHVADEVVNDHNHIRFVDFGGSCELF